MIKMTARKSLEAKERNRREMQERLEKTLVKWRQVEKDMEEKVKKEQDLHV